MPNYSPAEETSLMALLAALRGGMEPTTGYQMFSDILNQQAARVDERQERLRSLQDLLTQQAMTGQSLEGARALADAYTPGGGTPPMINQTINALYPGGPEQIAPEAGANAFVGAQGNPQYAVPSRAGISTGIPYGASPPPMEQGPQQQVSPTAPPVDPGVALQEQAAALQAAQDIEEAQAGPPATVGDVVSGIYAAKAANASNDTILKNIRLNPEAMEIVVKNYSSLTKIFPGLFPDRSASQGGV
jgi:hypothetical protein